MPSNDSKPNSFQTANTISAEVQSVINVIDSVTSMQCSIRDVNDTKARLTAICKGERELLSLAQALLSGRVPVAHIKQTLKRLYQIANDMVATFTGLISSAEDLIAKTVDIYAQLGIDLTNYLDPAVYDDLNDCLKIDELTFPTRLPDTAEALEHWTTTDEGRDVIASIVLVGQAVHGKAHSELRHALTGLLRA